VSDALLELAVEQREVSLGRLYVIANDAARFGGFLRSAGGHSKRGCHLLSSECLVVVGLLWYYL